VSGTRWRAGGATVRGALHVRSGRPNQDAVGVRERPPHAIAVADGHGDARCTRADVGAALAVAVALETAVSFAAPEARGESLRAALAERIVGDWTSRVERHLEIHPIEGSERAVTSGLPPLYAYGSTLLAAFVTGDEILALQIGDGDLLIADDGVRRVFERDPRLSLHETTSLCQSNARAEVRVARLRVGPDALILAATDGYANSFVVDADFTRVASDFRSLVGTHGLDVVIERLPDMLDTTSREGSGDDISVALLATVRS